MLWELLESARTKSSHNARRLGYVYETVAMAARFSRVRTHWESHLKKSRDFIQRAAPSMAAGDDVVIVLGSGWTFDVPLEFLQHTFREVILVDMVHPNAVRKRAAKSTNVRLMEADVSGVVASLLENVDTVNHALTNSKFPELPRASLIISANLLSQLAIPIVRHAETCGVTETSRIRRTLLLHHARWLKSLSVPLCLISDYVAFGYDVKGACVEEEDLIAGLKLKSFEDEWTWKVAPFGEVAPDRRYEHRVRALCVGPGEMCLHE